MRLLSSTSDNKRCCGPVVVTVLTLLGFCLTVFSVDINNRIGAQAFSIDQMTPSAAASRLAVSSNRMKTFRRPTQLSLSFLSSSTTVRGHPPTTQQPHLCRSDALFSHHHRRFSSHLVQLPMASVFVESESEISNTTEHGPLHKTSENDPSIVQEEEKLAEYAARHSTLSQDEAETTPITSQPIPGGNWNPEAPLEWCKNFGRRSPEYEAYLETIAKLGPGDEGYFDVSDVTVPSATIVRTKEEARCVVDKLMNSDPSIFHACDTEVMDIDLKEVGPVGNGYVTCVSVYSGPDFDYGLGQGLGTTLWIENIDDAFGVLQEFKEWFESERFLKVFHNYGFDRQVL